MRLLAVLLTGFLFAGGVRSAEAPSFREREALAKLQAMDLFPILEQEDSELATQVAAEVNRLEREQPAYFKEPAWPVRVARRVAAQLGIQPRTVEQIRSTITESFDVAPEEIQRIHGIGIISARFSVGREWLDVKRQIAARVSPQGLVVDCDRTLLSPLADETQFKRQIGEGHVDYWKRQRGMVAASAGSREGKAVLRVTFELHSESKSAVVNEGERLMISDEGQVTISKIVHGAHPARNNDAGVKTGKGGAKKKNAAPFKDTGGPAAKSAGGRMQPR